MSYYIIRLNRLKFSIHISQNIGSLGVVLTLGVHFEIIHKSIDYQLTFHNASLDICVNPNIAKCNIRLTKVNAIINGDWPIIKT